MLVAAVLIGFSGRPAFMMRAVLAATLSSAYGIYSGYELGENEPASPQNEEYADSEKYELKHREWNAPHSIAPYIAKIKASGADAVVTGNWGSDLALLVKAANEGGYNGKFFTYYTGVTGTPTALGQTGAGKVYQIAYAHYYRFDVLPGVVAPEELRVQTGPVRTPAAIIRSIADQPIRTAG